MIQGYRQFGLGISGSNPLWVPFRNCVPPNFRSTFSLRLGVELRDLLRGHIEEYTVL
jgi:hypothetical protein